MAMSRVIVSVMVSILLMIVGSAVEAQSTNPTDLAVLHEMMRSMNYEYDWGSLYPDPCSSGPQGIMCTPDPVTNILYVTQLQFGYISPVANLIPCSSNATIPDSIAALTRVETLSFYNCFKGPTPASIPSAITSLGPTLRLLSFSGNNALTGAVPPGIGNLTGLQRLVLSQNSLSGTLPEEMGQLQRLIQLDISHNNFSGPIPSSWSRMSSLLNMDLRYNSLEGEFPSSFSSGLFQLQRLAASYNKITGPLPSTFTGMSSLAFLDLSHNRITGELPASVRGLSNLQDLYLNSNPELEGAIPEAFGEQLTNLVRLDLSSCNIGSVIPETIQKLDNLRFFSVSNNRLLGRIPFGLATLPRIFTLNLDGNMLSGPVPFPPTFVKKMGRNMKLDDNPGLCYTSPQLVSFAGLSQCPPEMELPLPPLVQPSVVIPVSASPPVSVTTPNDATAKRPGLWGLIAFALGFLFL